MTKPRLMRLIVLLAIVLAAVMWSLGTRHAAPSVASKEVANDDSLQAGVRAAELEAPPTSTERSPTIEPSVTAKDLPLLVAGVVVDDAGDPISDALVELNCVHILDASRSIHLRQSSGGIRTLNLELMGSCSSDQNGHFEIRGTYVDGGLNLRATHPESTDPAACVSQPGTEDARLVLHMAGSMHARVVLPGDAVLAGLHIYFSPFNWSQTSPSISTDASGVLVTQLNGGFSERRVLLNSHPLLPTDETDALVELGSGECAIRLTLPKLAPDQWSMIVSIDTARDPIATVNGITVHSHGWADDPRVNPLDLRSVLALVKLTINDPAGARVSTSLVRFRSLSSSEDDRTQPIEQGTSTFYARIGAEFDVSAPGFSTQRVVATQGERTIVLQRGKRVRLVLDGAGVPAPPLRLRVALVRQPVAVDKHAWFVVDTQDEARIENLAARSTIHWYRAGQFDGSGSADVIVEGPGEYFPCWYVGRNEDQADRFQVVQLNTTASAHVVVPESANEASVTIHLDAGDLAAAVERL